MPETTSPARGRTLRTLHAHLVLSAALVTASFGGVIALSIFVPIAVQLDHTVANDPVAIGLAEHFLFLHSGFWPIILLSLLASIVSGTVLYRRMRTPLVRFTRCFREIAQGTIPRMITIREVDYLAEEAAAVNDMISALARERSERLHAVARLHEIAAELASTSTASNAVLEDLQAIAKKLSVRAGDSSDDAASR